jgi:hypothetical protein
MTAMPRGLRSRNSIIASQHRRVMSRDSSVGIATVYGLADRRGGSSSPGRVKNFHFSIPSRPALGSTQPPIKWLSGALSRGLSGRGVKLTTHLQLVPRARNVDLYIHSHIRLHGVMLN